MKCTYRWLINHDCYFILTWIYYIYLIILSVLMVSIIKKYGSNSSSNNGTVVVTVVQRMSACFKCNFFSFCSCFGLCLKSKKQGISRSPWGKSPEYLCPSVTEHDITLPHHKNSEQTLLSRQMTNDHPTPFHSYCISIIQVFWFSITLQLLSYSCPPYLFVHVVAANTTVSSKLLHTQAHYTH